MDRKSIIAIAICFLVLLSWYPLLNKVFPPKPLPPGATNAAPARLAATNGAGSATASNLPPVLEAATPTPAAIPVLAVNTNLAEQLIEVTNANARYTFSSYGGGLKLVELLHYPETVASHREKRAQTNRVATLNAWTPAPTLALLDGAGVQGDGVFKLTRTTSGVRAEKALTNGLVIVKEFQPSTNYLVAANIRLDNHSGQALALPEQSWVVGTATPMNAQDDGSAVGVMWSDGAKAQDILGASHFSDRGFMCTTRVPPAEYRGGQSNVAWAAVHNQFFALALMPPAPARDVVIRKVELPAPSAQEASEDSRIVKRPLGYEASLTYGPLTLGPGQGTNWQVYIFAGPKEYRTLANIAEGLKNNVDAIMDFGAFFGFFSKGLLLGMNALHQALHLSYGWAIIAITIVLKVVFWPLTQASTRAAKRMQALQPQLKALQEKYKEDPARSQRKMMEFYKEHKINPMSGCLPTLIQMPVFIGFFYMIRSAIELRGASFLWVADLSRPDTLFLIPGVNFPFNLLPLIMGATMLWQSHLTPAAPGMDPMQAKMMRYMPVMFLVFLYNFSAGLTLYWTVNNLLSVLQTKLTRTQPGATPTGAKPVLTAPAKKRK